MFQFSSYNKCTTLVTLWSMIGYIHEERAASYIGYMPKWQHGHSDSSGMAIYYLSS